MNVEELRSEVLGLRKKVRTALEETTWYSDLVDKLPEQRWFIAKALSIVDSLIALRAPEKIEKDWSHHISEGEVTRQWWTSLADTREAEIRRPEREEEESPSANTDQVSNPPSPSLSTSHLPIYLSSTPSPTCSPQGQAVRTVPPPPPLNSTPPPILGGNQQPQQPTNLSHSLPPRDATPPRLASPPS
ncbi:hypothetical protein E2C01_079034 [Portunus trituberculatus]|uniref:Uncharacterized protein n=1 Tax=Portunus trituberculatus TaxID=210409 RepID=A0A5B7IRS8_PORTR|nr:hypothetical protein [Portunus trituberculatus]